MLSILIQTNIYKHVVPQYPSSMSTLKGWDAYVEVGYIFF